jgi:uncharacterized protein HemY
MAGSDVLEGAEGVASFTERELIAALEAAMRGRDDGPADAFTVSQLSETTGREPRAVRLALAALKRAGRLQLVAVKRQRLDDRWATVMAYRLCNPVEFDGIRE